MATAALSPRQKAVHVEGNDVRLREDFEYDTITFQVHTHVPCDGCGVPLMLGFQNSMGRAERSVLAVSDELLKNEFARQATIVMRSHLAGSLWCQSCRVNAKNGGRP